MAKPYAVPFASPNATAVKCRPVPSLKYTTGFASIVADDDVGLSVLVQVADRQRVRLGLRDRYRGRETARRLR
jgi:hypothetical protein